MLKCPGSLFPACLLSFAANAVGACLVRLRCHGARRAGLPQRRHLRGPGQLQPLVVERTPAWGAGALPCQLRHTSAAVRAQCGPGAVLELLF